MNKKKIPFDVVFLAGGQGTRMGKAIPKQYLLLNGKILALHSFEIFLEMEEVETIVVVCDHIYQSIFQESANFFNRSIQFALPGKRRQDSLWNGISCLQENNLVCIHDAARPLLNKIDVQKVVQAADRCGAAVVGIKVTSTIKKYDASQMNLETIPRENLWEMQTPQVIRLDLLKEGFAFANANHLTVTDDVSLVELLKKRTEVVQGNYTNIKVTTAEDLAIMEEWVKSHASL